MADVTGPFPLHLMNCLTVGASVANLQFDVVAEGTPVKTNNSIVLNYARPYGDNLMRINITSTVLFSGIFMYILGVGTVGAISNVSAFDLQGNTVLTTVGIA